MSNNKNKKKIDLEQEQNTPVYFDNNWVFTQALQRNRNKYFNLFLNNFEWTGLDYRQIKFIMTKLWDSGRIAAFKVPLLNEVAFAPVENINKWDMYHQPEQISLYVVENNPLTPRGLQVVDKDVVIGYINPDHQSNISSVVEWYIMRISQAECVINTNLQLQKMPFLIPVDDEEEAKKLTGIVNEILNNKIVITATGVDANTFKAVQTNGNYIIDKLVNYKKGLENELKTILGIDNQGQEKAESLRFDEVNANNAEINSYNGMYESELKAFCERINEVFGVTITVKCKQERMEPEGEYHEMTEKSGPEEGSKDEE